MAHIKGVKQKSYARKRRSKQQVKKNARKRCDEEEQLSGVMNHFLGRVQVIPTVLTMDIDSLWNKLHERDKNHTPREISIDDSAEESTDKEFENEDEVEIGEEIISDEEDNEVDVESKSVMNSFISDAIDCLRKELINAVTMIDECSEDKVSLVESLHDHNLWIRSEAILIMFARK